MCSDGREEIIPERCSLHSDLGASASLLDFKMKYISFFFVVLLFITCRRDSETSTEQNNPQLGDSFDLKIGESVSIKNEQLNFQFVTVSEDSRCPIGALCIWAGNASVVIKIYNMMDTLNTFLDPKEINYGSYKITLLKLSPYPQIGVPRDTTQYVAQFVVTKN
jgi:hypothetical protein